MRIWTWCDVLVVMRQCLVDVGGCIYCDAADYFYPDSDKWRRDIQPLCLNKNTVIEKIEKCLLPQ